MLVGLFCWYFSFARRALLSLDCCFFCSDLSTTVSIISAECICSSRSILEIFPLIPFKCGLLYVLSTGCIQTVIIGVGLIDQSVFDQMNCRYSGLPSRRIKTISNHLIIMGTSIKRNNGAIIVRVVEF